MQVAVGGPIGSELSEPRHREQRRDRHRRRDDHPRLHLRDARGDGRCRSSRRSSASSWGSALIGLLGHVAAVPSIAPTLATMIGLGVGIDYALFLVTRHRVEPPRRHGVARVDRADRGDVRQAIVFAGSTVVIALVSLLVAGIPLVTSLGYASALAVMTAVLAAITLLPAVLSLIGHADRLAARCPPFMRPKPKQPGHGLLGRLGAVRDQATRGWRMRRRGDPARAADHPAARARPRPGGHRRDAQGHARSARPTT